MGRLRRCDHRYHTQRDVIQCVIFSHWVADDFLDSGLGFRRYYLAYKIVQRQPQIFTLEFVADDIQFVVNKASGRIVSAKVIPQPPAPDY